MVELEGLSGAKMEPPLEQKPVVASPTKPKLLKTNEELFGEINLKPQA